MNLATTIGDGARRLLRRQGRTRNDVRRDEFDICTVVWLTVQTSGDRVEGKKGLCVKGDSETTLLGDTLYSNIHNFSVF